jgi:DNA-binding MarR family transcriptional regulator
VTTDAEPEPRLSYLIARLDRLLRAEMADALSDFGLSVPQYTVLSVLRSRSGLSNAQLARRSYVTPQAMHQILTSLETAGLVVREEAGDHKHVRLASLTGRGQTLLDGCDTAVDGLEDEAFASLSPSERHLLRTLVGRSIPGRTPSDRSVPPGAHST